MIEFLIQLFGPDFYNYLDILSIGALYNTNSFLNSWITQMIAKDCRIINNPCSCNICDGDEVDFPITMNTIYRDAKIKLLCPWYFIILNI